MAHHGKPSRERKRGAEGCTSLLPEGLRLVPGEWVVPGGKGAGEGESPGRGSASPGRGLQGPHHTAVFGQRRPRPCRGFHGLRRRNPVRMSTTMARVAARSPAERAWLVQGSFVGLDDPTCSSSGCSLNHLLQGPQLRR